MIALVDRPEGLRLDSTVMWIEPVYNAGDLPATFARGDVAYDLSSERGDPKFFVGLGDGKACRVDTLASILYVSTRVDGDMECHVEFTLVRKKAWRGGYILYWEGTDNCGGTKTELKELMDDDEEGAWEIGNTRTMYWGES